MTKLSLVLALVAIALVACAAPSDEGPRPRPRGISPDQVYKLPARPTATPVLAPVLDLEAVFRTALGVPDLEVARDPLCDGLGHCWRWGAWRFADDTAWTPQEAPVAPKQAETLSGSTQAASVGVAAPQGGSWAEAMAACLVHPDRYNWRAYAAAYDWPLDELANVIAHESGGDLCAVNASSGATCWIQQHPGGAAFLDPATCMAQGYSKWVSGGRSFAAHWYAFW